MRRYVFVIMMLAGVALACNLGAEPTLIPTLSGPTATLFILGTDVPIATASPILLSTPTDISNAPPVVVPCTYPAGWIRYIVVPGDTLGDIAARTRTTIAVLVSGNCLSNPDLIAVGQTLYLPNIPFTPTARVNTAIPQSILLLVQPAAVVNGQYQVSPGPLTLTTDNIQGGVRIVFEWWIPNGGSPHLIGSNPVNGLHSQIGWDISSVPGYNGGPLLLDAVALDAAGRPVQYSNQLTVVGAGVSTAPNVGAVSVGPSQYVGGQYVVRPGVITVYAYNVRNIVKVSFVLSVPSVSGTLTLGADTNPASNGSASITWYVAAGGAPFSGTLTAYGYTASGAVVTGGSITIAYSPS